MDPVAIKIGALAIRWYGIMAALGFLAAVMVGLKNRKFAEMTKDQVYNLLLVAMVSGIVGARFFYVVQFWSQQFRGNLLEIFRIDHGGLVFYGGFICAMLALWIYCRKNKLDILKVLSFLAPSLSLGHVFGRIGCFLNGCCFGRPTGLPWGYTYPAGTAPAERYHDLVIHPVQLYEVIGNIVIFGVLQYLLPKTKSGQLAGLYMIIYGILRFSDEFFRGDHKDFIFGVFTPAQTICLFLVPLGIALFIYSTKRGKDGGKETAT